MLLFALPTVHSPHVLTPWQLKGCDYLGPDCLLKQAESSILSMTCSGDQLYVRVRGRVSELLREEGGLSHGYLATWPNIQQAVAHLKCESIYLVRCCLLTSVHFKLSIHLKLRVQPVPLHVQPLLLVGWLPLQPPGLAHLPRLSAGKLEQERVAQPAAKEQIARPCQTDTGGQHAGCCLVQVESFD